MVCSERLVNRVTNKTPLERGVEEGLFLFQF